MTELNRVRVTSDGYGILSDEGEPPVVVNIEKMPFRPRQDEPAPDEPPVVVDGWAESFAHMRNLREMVEEHTSGPIPMLRQARDDLGRTGYGYEGEPLLTYLRNHRKDGFVVMLGRQVPAGPSDERQATLPLPYEEALAAAFLIARTLPSGLGRGERGSGG